MRRLRSTDGVEVAVHDFGGRGKELLFVHATGFCAQVFSPLASLLGSVYRCRGVDLRGHGLSATPPSVDYAWPGFAEDVLAAVDGLSLDHPMAVGHSSGGAAVLLAEAERPGTFVSLWCYEPIVWEAPEKARSRAERLAEGARRRRDRFPSRDEAYANFAAKPPFSALAPAALRAYVDHGFAEAADGSVTLRCRPDAEAAIYLGAVEGDRFSRLKEVTCPVVVAAGGGTDAITPERAQRIVDALPDGRLAVFPRLGHFGPLEDPQAVAQVILRG
ncbi:MAG: alpha/beta hydrolase [Actinomycetota bacterium]|nr:alpha/beta hydrolase [Actinomycetota bacterium]